MSKISVVIIAHNEEKYIQKCIESILHQTKIPDEIVLIAHNCTDQTEEIVKKYSQVRVVSFIGPVGITHARMRGFEEATEGIVVCIDGDAWAQERWMESLINPLEHNQHISGVGGVVECIGTLFGPWASFKFFYLRTLFTNSFYFWGPSFAVRLDDYKKVGGFKNFFEMKEKLKLSNNPDDVYLSLLLSKIGKVVLVKNKKSKVYAQFKHNTIQGLLKRPFQQMLDAMKLYTWFKN